MQLKQPEIAPFKKFPNAIIIGARKGGTRALLDALALHPNIKIAKHEIHFFDDNATYENGFNWYKEQMPYSNLNDIVIEKTPGYFTSKFAPKRIYQFDKTIKLIIILRNPIQRIISDFTQVYFTRQQANKSLPIFEKEAFLPGTDVINTMYKPIRNSLYILHIKNYLEYFDAKQILFINGDNFVKKPLEELQKVEQFLSLRHLITDTQLVFDQTKGFFCFKMNFNQKAKCLGSAKGRTHIPFNFKTIKKLKRNLNYYNKELMKVVNITNLYYE
uniref:Sulfotransfer_1 domain-containing protein n=1 Tax=Rhabditophanes sp. KR3021 TaxID=114890 RepID=A0AC35U676_9BILA